MKTAEDTVIVPESVAGSREAEAQNDAVNAEESAASKEEASTGEKAVTEGASAVPGKKDANERIRELNERTKAAEESERKAREEAAYYQGLAESGKTAEPAKPVDDRPLPGAFKTYDEYVEALTDWKLEKKEAQRVLNETVMKAEAKYPDFKKVAFNPDLAITPAMSQVIRTSESGVDVAYHLGKNPAEAARIAQLPPIAQVRELGRIEERLSTQTKQPAEVKRISAAPAPPRTITGGTAVEKNPENMSFEEYSAWRSGQ